VLLIGDPSVAKSQMLRFVLLSLTFDITGDSHGVIS